jgi:membrane protein required for beta-lactamase induction
LSDRKFVAALLAAAIGLSPLILFSWIWLVATVDFGDVLAVLCVLVVQYEIGQLRKEERATYRAIRRAEARRIDAEPWPTRSRFGESQ